MNLMVAAFLAKKNVGATKNMMEFVRKTDLKSSTSEFVLKSTRDGRVRKKRLTPTAVVKKVMVRKWAVRRWAAGCFTMLSSREVLIMARSK